MGAPACPNLKIIQTILISIVFWEPWKVMGPWLNSQNY